MNLHDEMILLGDQAVRAARGLVILSNRKKKSILEAMADELEAGRDRIVQANALDMTAAREAGLSQAMLDRLELTEARIDSMIKGIRNVVALEDPVGKDISSWMRPNGLEIRKTRVPIGVIGIIFESRPNVTADATALCIKTSNAVILRGGKERHCIPIVSLQSCCSSAAVKKDCRTMPSSWSRPQTGRLFGSYANWKAVLT